MNMMYPTMYIPNDTGLSPGLEQLRTRLSRLEDHCGLIRAVGLRADGQRRTRFLGNLEIAFRRGQGHFIVPIGFSFDHVATLHGDVLLFPCDFLRAFPTLVSDVGGARCFSLRDVDRHGRRWLRGVTRREHSTQ